jgi:predicted DCC family thiol-disulfide oxidoreductase YuxK
MLSLASEFTDTKSRHARGWLFFDADCAFCVRFARWIAPALRARGIELALLQDRRVGALLGLPGEELLRALRLVFADGRRFAGADTILALAQEIGWARPIAWFAGIPGATRLLHWAYARIAAKRGCAGAWCSLEQSHSH